MLPMDELTRKKLIIELVCDVVCTEYGIDVNRVFSEDRHKKVSEARVLIVYILHKDLGLTIPFLAQEFERSTSWVLKKCAIKKQHISMYDDCYDEHKRLLDLIRKTLSL
jgi:chromosomal replication initiation ATPase DnaA